MVEYPSISIEDIKRRRFGVKTEKLNPHVFCFECGDKLSYVNLADYCNKCKMPRNLG